MIILKDSLDNFDAMYDHCSFSSRKILAPLYFDGRAKEIYKWVETYIQMNYAGAVTEDELNDIIYIQLPKYLRRAKK